MRKDVIKCPINGILVNRVVYCENSTCNNCQKEDEKSGAHLKKEPKGEKLKIPKKEVITAEDHHYVFTRHFPGGQFTEENIQSELDQVPAYLSETKLPFEIHLSLISHISAFKRTQNPVYAIEAFLLAHENGLYPPRSILNFFSKVFEEYWKSKGKRN